MTESYLCNECEARFGLSTDYGQVQKAPCPNCETCALTKITSSPISAKKTASDIFWRISRYNGR